MEIFKALFLSLFLLFPLSSKSSINKTLNSGGKNSKIELLKLLATESKSLDLKKKITKLVLSNPSSSIPVLIEVMKSKKYSDQSRWMSVNLLARSAGKKSSKYISLYASHPEWFMRMASLKALLNLSAKEYESLFIKSLDDKSMLVRVQAIENLRVLKVHKSESKLLKMLNDKKNFSKRNGKYLSNDFIKKIIVTLGDLGHNESLNVLSKLLNRSEFNNATVELNKSLMKIAVRSKKQGKKSL